MQTAKKRYSIRKGSVIWWAKNLVGYMLSMFAMVFAMTIGAVLVITFGMPTIAAVLIGTAILISLAMLGFWLVD